MHPDIVSLDLRVRTEVLMSRWSLWSRETILYCGEHHEAGTVRRRKDGPDGPARLRSTRHRPHWQPVCIRAGRSLIARYPQWHPEGQRKLGPVDRALGAGANWIATTGFVGLREFRQTASGHLPCRRSPPGAASGQSERYS